MANETLNEQVTRLMSLTAEIAQKDTSAISLLNKVYSALFAETIQQGCGNCYQKAFYRISKYSYLTKNKKMKKLEDRAYILKAGRSIQNGFGGDTLTNDNLTDKVAAKLIKDNPGLAKHFDKLPEEPAADLTKTPEYKAAKAKFAELYKKWNALTGEEKASDAGKALSEEITPLADSIKEMEATA